MMFLDIPIRKRARENATSWHLFVIPLVFSSVAFQPQHPSPDLLDRLDVSWKPEPLKDFVKSTLRGFTSSNRFLSMRYRTPRSVKVTSLPFGSSRAIPREGPPHPRCLRIRMD